MGLLGSIAIVSTWTQTPANLPGALPVRTSQSLKWNATYGTGADQADKKYSIIQPMAASTPFVIDLTALVDSQGNTFALARLKSLSAVNRSQVPGQVVQLGYATTTANAFAGIVSNPGQVTIRPSTATSPGAFGWIAPGALGAAVDATHKLVQFDPGANPITIEVEIIGASV